MVLTPKPEWFLAPRNIIPDTTLTLGLLLTSPSNPTGPPYLHPVQIDGPIHSQSHPWSSTTSSSKGGNFAILTSFLANIVGVGVDVSGQIQWSDSNTIKVDSLEVSTFQPTTAYLTRLLEDTRNVTELGASGKKLGGRFQKLFVVTGVQVARGGTISTTKTREVKGEVRVKVDPGLIGAGVPGLVGVEPKVGGNWKVEKGEDVGRHDFVYAFKINKLVYRREKGIVSQERYTKGSLFGEQEKMRPQEEEGEGDEGGKGEEKEQLGFKAVKLEEESAGMDEFGVEGEEVEDENGEVCVVIDPRNIDEDDDESDEIS